MESVNKITVKKYYPLDSEKETGKTITQDFYKQKLQTNKGTNLQQNGHKPCENQISENLPRQKLTVQRLGQDIYGGEDLGGHLGLLAFITALTTTRNCYLFLI